MILSDNIKLYDIICRIVLIINLTFAGISLAGCSTKQTYLYSDNRDSAEGASDILSDNSSDELGTEDVTFTGDCTSEEIDNSRCAVYVCGAVSLPGVYYLDSHDIKQDAVIAAGGMTEKAAYDYVNLAEGITDGERIYIPYQDDIESGIYSPEDNNYGYDNNSSDKVNINSASRDELMTLTGIGGGKADAIIAYREDNGKFSQIEDVKKVPGIKDATFNSIKDHIVVD